jgi:acetylornithine deacetylase
MLDRIVHHLSTLVACDSQNPPRQITPEAGMFVHARADLEGGGI